MSYKMTSPARKYHYLTLVGFAATVALGFSAILAHPRAGGDFLFSLLVIAIGALALMTIALLLSSHALKKQSGIIGIQSAQHNRLLTIVSHTRRFPKEIRQSMSHEELSHELGRIYDGLIAADRELRKAR